MTNADFIALHQYALAESNAILGTPFTFGAKTYTGIVSDVEIVSTLLDGGQLEGLATVVVVEIAQMPTAPAIGKLLKIGGRTLRVEKVKSDESSHELTCVSAAN